MVGAAAEDGLPLGVESEGAQAAHVIASVTASAKPTRADLYSAIARHAHTSQRLQGAKRPQISSG
ncbi:hypothetical protein AWC22_04025 [Mycobacterium riyadhense]|uniref:Uncharacterized protein n=1 Tax=Mycobacterium riyadhense TaxID=486698 RepID=A0A1X2BGN2_9MYCO|nr:hypothetical protein AWC22_04025 [Mycobacterium riyadhense]